jgi:5,10-methylenetetrahydrofolate reductase
MHFLTGQHIIEIEPPRGSDGAGFMRKASTILDAGHYAAVVDFPDREQNLAAARQYVKGADRVILNVSCHHTAGELEHFLYQAAVSEYRSLFLVYGNPQEQAPAFPSVSALITYIREWESSNHYRFSLGVSADPWNPERQVSLLKKREEAGADYFMTQPLSTDEDTRLDAFRQMSQEHGVTIPGVTGIFCTYRNKLPDIDGFKIPGAVRRGFEEGRNNAEVHGESLEWLAGKGIKTIYHSGSVPGILKAISAATPLLPHPAHTHW